MENLDIVLLDNSLTIWCVLMTNDAFMMKENCQHHFHLTLDLACLFWPQSHSLWWLGFCFCVVPADPRFITGNYCLHEVGILISTLQQISGYCKVSLFLLDCQQFWENFRWDTFHAQIFCQKRLYQTKWKPQLSNCYSSTAECTLSVISWLLLVEGLPERSPLSTDVCPSLNYIKHSTCVEPIAFFPKAFWIISYRFLSSSAKVCGKTWCRHASKLSQSSMQQAQRAQQVLADCQQLAIQAGSSNSCTC